MFEEYKNKISLRIDWAELDLFGHVNNVAYFRYIQAARVDLCDQAGLGSLNDIELGFIVASCQCQFKQPLKFPGEIVVYSNVNWIKNSSFQVQYLIVNKDSEICAEAEDVLVVYDYNKKEKSTISLDLMKKLEKQ